jgi:endonuclease YncB( thermonuclease family)
MEATLRARIVLAAAATAGLWLAGCERKPEPPPAVAPAPTVVERVRVMSGDALVVDGVSLRLANAFAPEAPPQARCWAEALAAKQAARKLQEMIRDARSISVEPTGKIDTYNRQIALVRLNGLDLGQTLFDEGLAAQPPSGRFEWCDPLSKNNPGAPALFSVMELAPR